MFSSFLARYLPNSSVNLNAEGNGSTFEQVTATTAANTLVVENGVTIKNLIILGGNVSVKDGAEIKAITNNSGKVIYLFVENGAIIPASLPNNVKIVKSGSNINDWEKDGEF